MGNMIMIIMVTRKKLMFMRHFWQTMIQTAVVFHNKELDTPFLTPAIPANHQHLLIPVYPSIIPHLQLAHIYPCQIEGRRVIELLNWHLICHLLTSPLQYESSLGLDLI
jgi:hypothetical protein